MSTAQTVPSTRPFTKRTALQMLLGAAIGFGVGFMIVSLYEHLHITPSSLSVADIFSLWVGITFVALSLASLYLSTNRKHLARQLEGESATLPATQQEVLVVRLQAGVLFLAGALMLAPALLQPAITGSAHVAVVSYAVIVVLFAAQTAGNVRIWQLSDEFMRQTIANICGLTFAMGQGMLFLWAAAEHLHLVHTGSSWSIFTVEMLLYIAVSSYITVRTRVK